MLFILSLRSEGRFHRRGSTLRTAVLPDIIFSYKGKRAPSHHADDVTFNLRVSVLDKGILKCSVRLYVLTLLLTRCILCNERT